MGNITATTLLALLPEMYLLAMIIFLLMIAAYQCQRVNNAMLAGTMLTLFGTALYLWPHLGRTSQIVVLNGMFATSSYIAFSKLMVLAAGGMSVLISADWLKEN